MEGINHQSLYIKIANAGRWLFWALLIHFIYDAMVSLALSGIPMNPHARSSAWGRFKWYFPVMFDLICMVIALCGLYFFQSALRKGIANANERLIKTGLQKLAVWLMLLAGMIAVRVVFEAVIQPNW